MPMHALQPKVIAANRLIRLLADLVLLRTPALDPRRVKYIRSRVDRHAARLADDLARVHEYEGCQELAAESGDEPLTA